MQEGTHSRECLTSQATYRHELLFEIKGRTYGHDRKIILRIGGLWQTFSQLPCSPWS